jgi:L-methionine (R)-S-oxide reductase
MSENAFYDTLIRDASALGDGERACLPLLANVSALLYQRLPSVNWVGFYLYQENDTLVLGPFQGNIACVRIPLGKGVCGSAAQQCLTIRVDDVHQFSGHIACDASTNAEIVLPIIIKGRCVGVLDIDSVQFSRFDERDQQGLQSLVTELALQLSDTDIEKYLA